MDVNISGTENLKEGEKEVINNLVRKTAKHGRYIQSMDLLVQAHRTSGARQKYSVHTKVLTDYGFFKAEADDWKLNLAIKDVLRKLDTHINNELKRKRGD